MQLFVRAKIARTINLGLMKRVFLLITAIFILSSSKGYSQTISFSGKDVQLTRVFAAIKSQTGYVFFYDAAILREARLVTIDLKNVSLEEALQQTLKDQPLGWLIENKTITIIKKPLPVANVQKDNTNPPITVTGTVMDEENEPIVGASVIVKGTGQGTSTNENGAFTIDVNKGTVLIFSSVSYAEKQIKVEGKTLAIQLVLDFKPLEKFIVGGNIMTIKRKAEVSSVAVIDSKTLENLPYQNIEQIFRGLVAGTNNMQSGYETSQYNYASGSVSIRGSAGFSGYGVVKVYVDGIQFAPDSYFLNTLDKNNIGHIEIVKGPSASTLYGSGANGGVILVYTKKPAVNSTNASVTASAGWYDSKWQSKKPFRQLYTFNVSQGFGNVSYFIAGDINNSETYMPDGRQNRYSLAGGIRYDKNNLKITVNGQHYDNNYVPERIAYWDTSSNAYFRNPGTQLPDSARGMVKSNVLNANVIFKLNKWWTHNLVAGWSDGYTNKEYFRKNPTLLKSEQKIKGPSFRYYNTINIKGNSSTKASLLTGVEYSNILASFFSIRRSGSNLVFFNTDTADLQKNTGVFAQLAPSYKDKIFLTISGRYDFNKNYGNIFNPRIGVTTNFQIGKLMIKPRVAWGKGIASLSPNDRNPQGSVLNPDLKPQQQSGWDYGLEGFLADGRLAFEISRYDYILKDGIYPMALTPAPNIQYENINAGKIENSGWEFSTNYKFKALSICGTFSIMNSILKEPLSGDSSFKDLTYPGEQMQFIPKYAAGLTMGYGFPKLFGNADQLYIWTQMTYTSGAYTIDYVKSIYDFYINGNFSNLNNYGLRYYKTQLSSSTKINLNLDYNVHKDLRFFMQLSNLTNNTQPEYTNVLPSIGRGWMFGLKYNFRKTADTGP